MRQGLSHRDGLLAAEVGERGVGAPGEAARRVVLALAVAHEIKGDGLGHTVSSRSATSDQPVTLVMFGCCAPRFHG
jgi:hypothetical protein